MILFLFNNVNPFVCKKLCHFIFLAFEKCESRILNIAAIYKVRIVRVIIAIIIIIYKVINVISFFSLSLNIINVVIYSWKCQ